MSHKSGKRNDIHVNPQTGILHLISWFAVFTIIYQYICGVNIKMFLYEYENLRKQMNMQFIIVDYLLATISISTYQVNVNFIHVLS